MGFADNHLREFTDVVLEDDTYILQKFMKLFSNQLFELESTLLLYRITCTQF